MKNLQYMDLFGTTFRFSTFGESKFHTFFGMFLSLVTYSLVAAFIGVFGLDMFNRSNPKVISQGVRPINYSRENITTENFTFAWRLEDESGLPFDFEGIFYPVIKYFVYDGDIVEEKTIKPTRCNSSIAPDHVFQKGRILNEWYCLDFNQNDSIIGGFWDAPFTYYFNIYIFYCSDNDAINGNCTSLSDLKKLLITSSKIYFSIMYPDFYFDPNNLVTPLRYQYVNFYNAISLNLPKIDRVFLKTIECQDDQDLLFTRFTKHEQRAYERLSQDFSLKFDSDFADKTLTTELYSLVIYYSKSRDLFTRTFMKLQDLAATVGGFMQVVLVIGRFLCQHYNSYNRNMTLINQLFEFEEVESERGNFEITEMEKTTKHGKENTESVNTVLKLKENNNLVVKENLHKKQLSKFCNANERRDLSQSQNVETGVNILTHKDDFESNQVQVHPQVQKPRMSKADLLTSMNQMTSLQSRKALIEVSKSKIDEEKLRTAFLKETPTYKNPKEFGLGLSLLIKQYLCSKVLDKAEKRKVHLQNFAKSYLMNQLDITSYMGVLANVEKMMLVIFNESQKHTFKCMKKPNLNVKSDLDMFEIKVTKDEDNLKELDKQNINLLKYYISKLEAETLNKQDLVLFDFLDSKYKNVILNEVNKEKMAK